jgi:hypothetical protein
MPLINDDNTAKSLHAYGGVFRWGSGVLGKSAIVAGLLVVGVLVVAYTLHSDLAKLAAIALIIGAFLFWYIRVMKFCDKHPAEAMLEGMQWAEHQRLQVESKGQPPSADIPFEIGPSPISGTTTRIGDPS